MKIFLALITVMTSVVLAQGSPDVVTLLAKTKASVSDELFHFVITYSDVRWENHTLYFTQTCRHDDVLDSYYVVTMKVALPAELIKKSQIENIERNEVTHSYQVRMTLPDIPSEDILSKSAETKDTEGNVSTVAIPNQDTWVDLFFSSVDDAETWKTKLEELLKE